MIQTNGLYEIFLHNYQNMCSTQSTIINLYVSILCSQPLKVVKFTVTESKTFLSGFIPTKCGNKKISSTKQKHWTLYHQLTNYVNYVKWFMINDLWHKKINDPLKYFFLYCKKKNNKIWRGIWLNWVFIVQFKLKDCNDINLPNRNSIM